MAASGHLCLAATGYRMDWPAFSPDLNLIEHVRHDSILNETSVRGKVRSGYLFRFERMRGLYLSHQNDRLRMMLALVHIDITPPHTPLPVFRRIGERTIPYSWQACKQLCHGLNASFVCDGLRIASFV
ncbi:uncharacterized protein TNCV_1964921 [Trichonephila clavipes]|nr:uncharacterized protein TNCV_1964921 [Trichonephila clavipes]